MVLGHSDCHIFKNEACLRASCNSVQSVIILGVSAEKTASSDHCLKRFFHSLLDLSLDNTCCNELIFRQSVKRVLSYFFSLSVDNSFFFRDRRRDRLPGNLLHRTEARRADFKACSAFYTFLLVNDMDPVFPTSNRLYWTSLKTNPAGLALIRIDVIRGCFTE